jgi:hypothetical protein
MAGIAFGLVEVLSFLVSNSPLGASKPFVETASIATFVASDRKWFDNKLINDNFTYLLDNYFSDYSPSVSWGTALLFGVFLGALLSSLISRDFKFRAVPTTWKEFYGPSKAKRFFYAFVGGFLVALGARFGGGCVSGQLISGFVQLGVGSMIFMMSLWMSGVMTAMLFYRTNIWHLTRPEHK